MKAAIVTKLYVPCPHCGEGEFAVSHLLDPARAGKRHGPWYCDECGRGCEITANSPDDMEVWPVAATMPRTLNLLTIPPRDHPVYLVVHGVRQSGEPADSSLTAYYYDEHTCPTNWVGSIEAFIEDGDSDPHGVARFVRAIDRPTLPADVVDYDLRSLFPEAFAIEGGDTIDGHANAARVRITPPPPQSPE